MFDAYIDNSGKIHSNYSESRQVMSYTFVVCTRGELRVNIYNSEHIVKANSLITLLPNSYFRVVAQSDTTELYVVSFSQQALSSADLFTSVLEHITHIVENPVVEFEPSSIEILCDYIKLIMRIKDQPSLRESSDFVGSLLKQFIVGIGAKYRVREEVKSKTDRSRAVVMSLIKLIITHYQRERSATFYANAMHLSPQHLSTVVKRVSNRTLSDIIAMFVIIDAQTKLLSTDLSIGQIATSLNFEDISIFGRYFKRYTKLSPRQYRNR